MIGDAIGFWVLTSGGMPVYPPLTYEAVSKIETGGSGAARAAETAVLGLDILWDNGDYIVWDNDTNIGWEV